MQFGPVISYCKNYLADLAHTPRTGAPRPPLTPADAVLVKQHLQAIIESEEFRPSKRCQEFLAFVIEHAIAGQTEYLKERAIGAEIFGKEPDYDTTSDSIVRVRASEVRRRLAHFYAKRTEPERVVIDLPAGSYIPEIHCFEEPALPPTVLAEEPPRPPARPRTLYYLLAALLATLGIIVVWLSVDIFNPADKIAAFWKPILDHSQPPVLCLGTPTFYGIRGDLRRRFLAHQKGESLPPERLLSPELDVFAYEGMFLGIGGTTAAGDIANYFGRHKKHVVIRPGSDSNFAELRNSPVILIGLNYNDWSLRAMKDLRFRYEHNSGGVIVDRDKPGQLWRPKDLQLNSRPSEDYGLISRFLHPESGQPIVALGGVTTFGTQAAGELITDPERFHKFLETAPAGWASKNVQVLIRTKVVGMTPGPAEIIAIHVW